MPRTSHRQSVEQVFHALGDATRRAMVERLSQGPISVTGLAAPLSISLAAVVQHLQVLEKSGLVRTEKTGRVRTCSLREEGLAVVDQWVRERRKFWERSLDRLGEVLGEDETN